jgi:hypothetical protein
MVTSKNSKEFLKRGCGGYAPHEHRASSRTKLPLLSDEEIYGSYL